MMQDEAKHSEWIGKNMDSIVNKFRNLLNVNGYDDYVMSADLHVGKRNSPDSYKWFQSDSVIIFKTIGNGFQHRDDGWVGCPIKITAGVNKGMHAMITRIDEQMVDQYVVINDHGTVGRYKRSQFELFDRNKMREKMLKDQGPVVNSSVHHRLVAVVKRLNIVTKLGAIDLPSYANDSAMQCDVWADPIISQYATTQKLWTKPREDDAEFLNESATSWIHQKPSKAQTRHETK